MSRLTPILIPGPPPEPKEGEKPPAGKPGDKPKNPGGSGTKKPEGKAPQESNS